MIRSIKGSATQRFIESGKSRFSGMDIDLADQRIAELDAATSLSSLSPLNSVGLHKLVGNIRGYWSIDINGRWRLVFRFHDGNASTSRSWTHIAESL